MRPPPDMLFRNRPSATFPLKLETLEYLAGFWVVGLGSGSKPHGLMSIVLFPLPDVHEDHPVYKVRFASFWCFPGTYSQEYPAVPVRRLQSIVQDLCLILAYVPEIPVGVAFLALDVIVDHCNSKVKQSLCLR